MTDTKRTVLVAALLALAVFTGVALASPATATTTDAQANETTTTANETTTTTNETAANETASNQTASVSAPDQQFDGESLTVESATLPDGGFVVVYNQSGAVLGHTEYLDAGDHENLTVSLNATLEDPQVLVLGVNRNNGSETFNASEDTVSYKTANDKDVSDVSYVYFQQRGEETTTDRSTETERSTEMETDEPTETTASESGDDTETTTESSGSTPGFTPITAVVALVAAALVGLRRS